MRIVSEPWGQGKDFGTARLGETRGTGGGPRARGVSPSLGMASGAPRGTHVAVPPRGAWCGCDGQKDRKRQTHKVSSAGAGIWPGRNTETTRRRLAWHTGHCSRSTPTASLDRNLLVLAT